MAVIMQEIQEKADLQKTKVKGFKTRKACVDFTLGKNGGHMPSSLCGR